MLNRWIVLLWAVCFSQTANAVLKIDITEGIEGATPIAVIPFKWNGASKLVDADISEIVSSDLARSGKFSPAPAAELLARPQRAEDIHFKTWRVAGIDHLVIGAVNMKPDGQFRVEFRLFNVYRGEQVLGYSFNATRATLRAIAHQISDLIFEELTGLPGAFNSRIAYVTSSGNPVKYRLQVADTDGYNPQTLLTSKEPIMSPVWSPDGSRVVYVSFETGLSAIYIHNIHTGEREKVASYEGINSAPSWSPDGKTLAMTLSKEGNPDIYILSLKSGTLRRLTRHWAIDTEPAWMPDSQSLVFTSSRSGKPQLYQLSLDKGSRPRRLTFDGNYNANASVSADGKVVAYVHGANNSYKIAVLYLDTRIMQILTDGPLDESPDFAPNGTMVLYASQEKGKAILAAVSTDGRQKQRLALSDGEVREPSWAAKRN
ncbi:MAG: Tol-Pal system beta propeller repeat protein TolB [Gammaproteobacteria bacterium]